jgi:hypothetical protein
MTMSSVRCVYLSSPPHPTCSEIVDHDDVVTPAVATMTISSIYHDRCVPVCAWVATVLYCTVLYCTVLCVHAAQLRDG